MSLETDDNGNLPPLPTQRLPGIPVEKLLSIEAVTLAAGDLPAGILREFYRHVLGMKLVAEDAASLRFRHLNRSVILDRHFAGAGHLGLIVRNFTDAMLLLKQHQIPYEVLHGDSGFSRTAILRDPAGNWIHLVETRPI